MLLTPSRALVETGSAALYKPYENHKQKFREVTCPPPGGRSFVGGFGVSTINYPSDESDDQQIVMARNQNSSNNKRRSQVLPLVWTKASASTHAPWTFTKSSANFCLRSAWSLPDSASANCVMFMEQNFGPHMEQNFASL